MFANINSLSPVEIEKLIPIISSPLKWAEAFVNEPVKGELFKARFVQEKILGSEYMQNVICVYRRSGKCVAQGTKILNPKTLIPTPIEESSGNAIAYGYDFMHREWDWHRVEGFYVNGLKKCKRITFESGAFIEAPDNHPLFAVGQGWKLVEKLRRGDRIGAPRSIPVFGNLVLASSALFGVAGCIVGQEKLAPEGFEAWFSSHSKELPYRIFSLTKDCLRKFLHCLFERVGGVDVTTQEFFIELPSYEIASNIRHLFLRFGVALDIRKRGTKHFVRSIDELTITRALVEFGYPLPKTPLTDGLRSEVVQSVEDVGVRMTYDLGIDHPDHNFLAADILSHNTYSLDILALWGAMCHNNYKVMIACPNNNQVETIFDDIRRFVDCNPWIAECITVNQKSPARIKFSNGSQIYGFTTGAKSKGEGDSVRSQSADMVLLDEADFLAEADWAALIPIMIGDIDRMGKVRFYMASSIRRYKSTFHKFLLGERTTFSSSPTEGVEDSVVDTINRIKIPITQDPSITPEQIHKAKSVALNNKDVSWEREYLCELPEIGEGVFRKSDVDRFLSLPGLYGIERRNWDLPCFMGVDWDKYQAGSTIAIIQVNPIFGDCEVIYREEIPREEFRMLAAVKRVIELNSMFTPAEILVDAGFGETNIELLHEHGSRHPETRLQSKVKRVAFNMMVDSFDPIDGTSVKKRFKPLMVSILQATLEESRLKAPASDEEMKVQFMDYKVKSITESNITFISENEHCIDAVGLAMFGIYQKYLDVFRRTPQAKAVHLNIDPLSRVPENQEEKRQQKFGNLNPWGDNAGARSFARGFSKTGRRKSF